MSEDGQGRLHRRDQPERTKEVRELVAAGLSWEEVEVEMSRRLDRDVDRQQLIRWWHGSKRARAVPKRYATTIEQVAEMSESEKNAPSGLLYEDVGQAAARELRDRRRVGIPPDE